MAAIAPTTFSADAVLLSRARPAVRFRVQLTRRAGTRLGSQRAPRQLMDVKGGLNADGSVAGYDFATRLSIQRARRPWHCC